MVASKNNGKESAWGEYKRLARIIVIDAALFLTVIAVLLVAFWSLKLLEAAGYKKEQVEFIENIHFFAYGALTVILCCDMVMKMLTATLVRK